MTATNFILCIMFGCLGFFLAFFAARTLNIALLLLLVWVPLKVIDKCGKEPDWTYFFKMKNILLSLWKVLIDLLANMLSIATTASLVLFAIGGLTGFVMNLHLKGR